MKNTDMVVKIKGGLGNQLFQYAFGMSLEKKLKVNVIYDLSFYKNCIWNYKLKYFNLKVQEDKKLLIDKWKYIFYTDSLYNKIKNKLIKKFKLFYFFNNKYYIEKNLMFNNNIYDIKKSTYFDGFWQSEKYFLDLREELLEKITLKHELSEDAMNYLSHISNTNSVCMHIRRGDMAEDPIVNKIHGTCSMDYYKRALRYIKEKEKTIVLFIFSDDIMWVKNNMMLDNECIYIDKRIYDYEELVLMSFCKHNIIANSTFSWWGAWLGKNENKIVITPKYMFANKMNTEVLDVIGWIKLDDIESS